MARIIFWGIAVLLCAISAVEAKHTGPSINLVPNANGGYILNKDDELLGYIGTTLGNAVNTLADIEDMTLKFENDVSLKIKVKQKTTAWKDQITIKIEWTAPKETILRDCFDFGGFNWYGGPQQKEQYWPIEHGSYEKYSYVTKEEDNAAVIERYWLNSAGYFIYIDPEVPLFIDQHTTLNNSICFTAEVSAPYSSQRTKNTLSYVIQLHADAKVAHQAAVYEYLGKPKGYPDERMIQHPVWSTWARYSREIDETILLEYANDIISYGFNNSQFEIDDLWEVCYGSLTVNQQKFPDLKQTVQQIKALGFRVTIWVHPFINQGCEPWYTQALENGYLVLNEEGSPDTSWWNNNGSIPAYIDFTNPEAANWFSERVRAVLSAYDIDSVKFDAGESSWSPQIPVQRGSIELHPAHITETYVKTCAEFGNQIEVRAGARTQELPVFIRMVDKDTYWGFNNGLATLVTTLLQMNMNGYTLVLPDMIGGNGYNAFPSKELFIRWLQANVFMPSLQYSFAPWDYDSEAIEICTKYTDLHADYTPSIVRAMKNSMRYGTPVNAPIWWLDPTDQVALGIWDEFLLGEEVLAAPVLEESATARDIYLPKGTWLAEGNPEQVFVGPIWLKDYPAPLNVLPYFVRRV